MSTGWFPVEIKVMNNSGAVVSDMLWIKDSLFSFLFGETAYAAALGGLHCGIPITGSATLSGACNIDSNDGIVNGTLNLNGQSLTLQANVFFGFPGSSVSLTTAGSVINIGSGASLSSNTVWVQESDGDHYWAAQAVQASSPGTGWESRTTAGLVGSGDCSDSNANVNPGQTSYFTTATTTNMNLTSGAYDGGGEVNYDYNCDGVETARLNIATSSRACPNQTSCPGQALWYATVPPCSATSASILAASCSATTCNLTTAAQGCH